MTATSDFVIDSWAWLELFSGSERGKKVEQRMAEGERTLTSAVSLAEVVSAAARRRRPIDDKVAAIRGQSRVVSPTSDDAIEAGRLHADMKSKVQNFSLADAFVLQLARKVGGKVLTGDPDFSGIKEAELLQ